MRSAIAFLFLLGVGAAHAQGVVQPTNPAKTPPAYLGSDGVTKLDPLGVFLLNPNGSAATSATTPTVPYQIGTLNTSATVGTYVQVLAGDTARTNCTLQNGGTGAQTVRLNIGTDTTQPANNAVSPYVEQVGGTFRCGTYQGPVWVRSTVASDTVNYETDH